MVGANEEKKNEIHNSINNFMRSEVELRSKRELIEKFIAQNLPKIKNSSDVEIEFKDFWSREQASEARNICELNDISEAKFNRSIGVYLSSGRTPRDYEIADILEKKPSILQRSKIISKIKDSIINFLKTFVDGM